jgi:hypothetical protein
MRLNPDQLAEAREWLADVVGNGNQRELVFALSPDDVMDYLNRWYRTSDHEGCDRVDAFIEDFPPELFFTPYERETRALVGKYDRLNIRGVRHFPGATLHGSAAEWAYGLAEFLYRRYDHKVPAYGMNRYLLSLPPSAACAELYHRNPTKEQVLYAYSIIDRARSILGPAH